MTYLETIFSSTGQMRVFWSCYTGCGPDSDHSMQVVLIPGLSPCTGCHVCQYLARACFELYMDGQQHLFMGFSQVALSCFYCSVPFRMPVADQDNLTAYSKGLCCYYAQPHN